ncbi:phenylacetic acid catabolism protein [Bacillus sp. V3-13]|uniref:Phenylacetic acid catabolic protein n=1 Tax=Bacillus sp. V3-13 TaxID=2053728 RepID=UPI000C7734AA|nr:Phenylacetic acid catabolic protein [Bacillus sp. V3-13]PLR78747.1 phenylacetic acid catabolism protein [Bacillus sp. V3-13]
MVENKNSSLIDLAETIADNKFILGDRLVEVGISGPNLEATLSSIAMAQAELGHARLIYRWAGELKGLNDSKVDIKHQTGKAFRSLIEIDNWISLIAGLYTANVAASLVMNAIVEADHPEINPPFSKMLKEQSEHVNYSRSWCEQLFSEQGSIPSRFGRQLEKSAHEAEQWVRKIENDNLLVSEKIISVNFNLADQFSQYMKSLFWDGVVTNA